MFKKLRDKLKNWTKKVAETKPVETKEIKPPMKFNAGKQKYEPDIEAIKKPSFFKKVTSKISKIKISEKEFEVYSEELEMLLLENNVALEVAEKMIKELKKRIIGDSKIKEIIIATNFTMEGLATTLYLEKILEPFKRKVTKLARGLPVGGELEYTDEETLLSALEQRK